MRLMRAVVGRRPVVIARLFDESAVAIVNGQEFADLPELLQASGGDVERISPGRVVEIDERKLLNPVAAPGKVVCIGINYRLYAQESQAPLPQFPMLFAKWSSALTGPYADIPLPPESSLVDYEAELAFVFGRRCRRVTAAHAGSVVFGFTAANDVSMRDFQMHTTQFLAGKSWDRSTPLGPSVVPAGEVGGIEPDLAISGILGGEVVQDSRTSDLIFGIPQLVEYVTTIMTMEPGDVVLTGTPSGVGFAQTPPRGLRDGDVFEVQIDGIGRLENRFVREMPVAG